MNSKLPDLLAEVLAEEAPEFRAAALAATLRQARRRRRMRHARRAGGALAVALLAGWWLWPQGKESVAVIHPLPPPPAAPAAPAARSYQLVETQPLPSDALVASEHFAPVSVVSTAATVTQIATTAGNFRYLSDEQLLALLHPCPVALVRTGPDTEELVFANPEDRRRWMGNGGETSNNER